MNKTALITGAGKKRVGWFIAEALAKRGYSIAVHYRSSAADAEATVAYLQGLGVDAFSIQADLTDEQAVSRMIDAVLGRWGRVDALVCTAAIWNRKPLEDVTANDVREHFETNTLGTFLCAQRIGLAMTKQAEGGLIVTFGDWADARPYTGFSAYFPSKCAIPGMTRMFAVELGSRNPQVRVNAILPGPVMLPPDLPPEEREEAIGATLVKREGSPANVVAAVLSFLDNDFVTGVCLPVDGGRTIYARGL